MSRNGGLLIYKCRRCGGEDRSFHVPDVLLALSSLAAYGRTPKDWGMTAGVLGMHACADGATGVADLAGGQPDPEHRP